MRTIDPDKLEPVRGGFIKVVGGWRAAVPAAVGFGVGLYGTIKGINWSQRFLHRNDAPRSPGEAD